LIKDWTSLIKEYDDVFPSFCANFHDVSTHKEYLSFNNSPIIQNNSRYSFISCVSAKVIKGKRKNTMSAYFIILVFGILVLLRFFCLGLNGTENNQSC